MTLMPSMISKNVPLRKGGTLTGRQEQSLFKRDLFHLQVPGIDDRIQLSQQSERQRGYSIQSHSSAHIESHSSLADLEHGNKIQKNKLQLKLGGQNLKRLDFLEKFIREFPKIHHLDLTHNQINNKEMKKMIKVVQKNQYISQFEFAQGNKVKTNVAQTINKELVNNAQIQQILEDQDPDEMEFDMGKTLNLKNRKISDIAFVNKMLMLTDFTQL